MSKKKQILNTARILFNERGYYQVTIRMIAVELNMSSGNLNYHFKKREDIFEALYFEMVSVFDERIKNLPKTEVSISQIKNDIEQSMTRMIDYSFFWTDLYNLLTISDEVKSHFQEVYKMRINGCFVLFEKMKQKKLMKDATYEQEYKFLAERIVNHGNTWLYSTGLYEKEFNSNQINDETNTLLNMFYPFLTVLGKNELKDSSPEIFR